LAQNYQRTGLSPYNVSLDRGQVKWHSDWGDENGITIGSDANFYSFDVSQFDPELPGHPLRLGGVDSSGGLLVTKWQDWQNFTRHIWTSPPSFGQDNSLYFTISNMGIGGVVSYYTNGSLRWRLTTEPSNSACAIGDDGVVYFGTFSKDPAVGFLYAVNSLGSILWKVNVGSCLGNAPSLAQDGTIYILSGCAEDSLDNTNNRLTAINPNGSQRWSIPLQSYIGYPVIAGDGEIIVSGVATDGSNRSMLIAVTPEGKIAWSSELDTYFTCPALDSIGNIYVATNSGELHSYTSDGSRRWHMKYADFGPWVPSHAPVVSMNGVILVCGQGAEYNLFGQSLGGISNIYSFDLSGNLIWKCGIGEYAVNSAIIAENGMVLVSNDDGILAITDETDWNIPALIIASGFYVLLVLTPKERRGWILPIVGFVPISFVVMNLLNPDDLWYNLGLAVFIGLIWIVWMWASLRWMHEI
jgi:hypothetical protein